MRGKKPQAADPRTNKYAPRPWLSSPRKPGFGGKAWVSNGSFEFVSWLCNDRPVNLRNPNLSTKPVFAVELKSMGLPMATSVRSSGPSLVYRMCSENLFHDASIDESCFDCTEQLRKYLLRKCSAASQKDNHAVTSVGPGDVLYRCFTRAEYEARPYLHLKPDHS